VAHSLSANKRIRQTAKRRARNRVRKGVVRTQLKAVTKAFGAKDAGAAATEVKKAIVTLDHTASKGRCTRTRGPQEEPADEASQRAEGRGEVNAANANRRRGVGTTRTADEGVGTTWAGNGRE